MIGFLFAKLDAIGKKSEGPMYFLHRFDYTTESICTGDYQEHPYPE